MSSLPPDPSAGSSAAPDEILHFASQADADIFFLEKQIVALKMEDASKLSELERRLVALRAPVYRLPDDLLAEILELCVYSAEDVEKMFVISLKLSHIVSRWRKVALSTPRLWSALRVVWAPVVDEEFWKEQVIMISVLESRRASCPLQLQLVLAGSEGYEETPIMSALFEQCTALEVRRAAFIAVGLSNPLPLPKAKKLETLTIQSIHFPTTRPLIELLTASPELTRVCLRNGVVIDFPFSGRPIELPSLQSLELQNAYVTEIDDMSPLAFVAFLRAPQLHTVSLTIITTLKTYGATYACPSVRNLHITDSFRPLAFRDLLDAICAMPALETLTLDITEPLGLADSPPGLLIPGIRQLAFWGRDTSLSDLAHVLVEGTTTDVRGAGSLQRVEVKGTPLSVTVLEWIRGRVPEVVLITGKDLSWRYQGRTASMT